MTLLEARQRLNRSFVSSCRESGNCTPLEADDYLNEASRACIQACRDEHGAAWVGLINHYAGHDSVLWEWDGARPVYNFGADFVLPVPSEDVVLLIGRYRRLSWPQFAEMAELIDEINEAVERAGGVLLTWS